MCPSPNNSPTITSFRGLSIDSLDLSRFDSLFVVIVDKFCEHTKLVPWLKEVIRSLYVTPVTFQ